MRSEDFALYEKTVILQEGTDEDVARFGKPDWDESMQIAFENMKLFKVVGLSERKAKNRGTCIAYLSNRRMEHVEVPTWQLKKCNVLKWCLLKAGIYVREFLGWLWRLFCMQPALAIAILFTTVLLVYKCVG